MHVPPLVFWLCAVPTSRSSREHDLFVERKHAVEVGDALCANRPQDGILLVDAGSSGSKLFKVDVDVEDPQSLKVLTRCQKHRKRNSLLGLSAFGYEASDCHALTEPDAHDLSKLRLTVHSEAVFGHAALPRYAQHLLNYLRDLDHLREESKTSQPLAQNANEIPILATAGMRLLTASKNDAIWSGICETALEDEAQYRFAPRGPLCGTIPGTQEAFYEHLAGISACKPCHRLSATFTMGGASAQIAVPLVTEKSKQQFTLFEQRVMKAVGNCSGIRLASGQPIPIFSRKGLHCSKDFVDMRPITDVPSHLLEKSGLVKKNVTHLGLISVLGLGHLSGGTGVAGGINSIETWAENNDCGVFKTGRSRDTYPQCVLKLDAALAQDKIWNNLLNFFIANEVLVERLHFNTPAVDPFLMFSTGDVDQMELQAIKGKLKSKSWLDQSNALSSILALLERECSGNGSLARGFGYNRKNTCIKAYYATRFQSIPYRALRVRQAFQKLLAATEKRWTSSNRSNVPVSDAHDTHLVWNKADWSMGVYEILRRQADGRRSSCTRCFRLMTHNFFRLLFLMHALCQADV